MKFCHLLHSLLLYFFHPHGLTPTCVEYLSDVSLNGVFGVTATTYLLLFVATVALEAPVYWFFLKARPLSPLRFTALVLCINLCTHPLAVLGFPQFFALAGFPKVSAILTAEVFAPLVEALVLWLVMKFPVRRSFFAAIAANLLSWQLGGFLSALLF